MSIFPYPKATPTSNYNIPSPTSQYDTFKPKEYQVIQENKKSAKAYTLPEPKEEKKGFFKRHKKFKKYLVKAGIIVCFVGISALVATTVPLTTAILVICALGLVGIITLYCL